MKIKVIVEDGIIRGVLKDTDADAEVELIDTSDCYEDHEKRENYVQELWKNPHFQSCKYSVLDFT